MVVSLSLGSTPSFTYLPLSPLHTVFLVVCGFARVASLPLLSLKKTDLPHYRHFRSDAPCPAHTRACPCSFLDPIFDMILLSSDAIPVLHGYFRCVHSVSHATTALRRFLMLDDTGAAAYLAPYGSLHSDDKHILKTFCKWYQKHNIPADFDCTLFTDSLYENGPASSTSTDDAALPSLPNASGLPDPTEFLQSDTSVVSAACPTLVPHDYFLEIKTLASSNCTKYKNQLPFGADLQLHPEWHIHASKCILLDLVGFQQATIPKLQSTESSDIITWYNQYQQIAFQCGIHVILFSFFQVDCATYPCSVPASHVDTMNCAQLVHFSGNDIFSPTDSHLKLLQEHHRVHHSQESLCACNFLHCHLTHTVTALDSSPLPIPPRYPDSSDITTFASAMMSFMSQHGTAPLHYLALFG